MLQILSKHVKALAYSLEDGLLCSGSSDSTIKVWTVVRTEEGGDVVASSVCAGSGSGSGCGAIPSAGDGAYQQAPETHRLELNGHNGRVMALTMLSNALLASGGLDCTIRLWDLRVGCMVQCARARSLSLPLSLPPSLLLLLNHVW
jgi:WD40 repeat protein